MNHTTLGAIAVVVASLLWSLDGLLRQSLYSVPPTVVVFWEHLFGAAILLPIVLVTFKAFKKFSKKQWWALALVAFLSGALGTVLYTAALGKVQFIQFSVVVLIQQLQPIFAITAAALLLKEPLTKRFLSLSAVAIVAAYFVSFPDLTVSFSAEHATGLAALMALGAAAGWGISTAFSKYGLKNTSVLHVTAVRFGLTPIFALGLVFLLGHQGALMSLEAVQWKTIAAITFSTGLLALAIYYFGLQRIPASRSTILELTWPLSALAIGYLFFGDQLSLTQWVGAIALIASMFLVSQDARKIEQ